jgi:exoribonuclease-2
MHAFFEDDGALKAGTILADNQSSLQIEAASGKRLKIKADKVLLRFAAPGPQALLEASERMAAELDPDFLWTVAGDGEIDFEALATEYHGRPPTPPEAASMARVLHAHPMYFYRRGRGRYQPAPKASLDAALAGLEKKRREAETVRALADQLKARQLPDPIAAIRWKLLHAPDKQTLEYKALRLACDEVRASPLQVLREAGAITSAYALHYQQFLLATFPKGTGFGPVSEEPPVLPDLPLASVDAFSIDDSGTTEIDDAFSAQSLADGGTRVGVHIAAPALTIPRDCGLDRVARDRLSTVYMPGDKITMLPPAVIEHYTLAAGRDCPALSLYVDFAADGTVQRQETKVERVRIAANLRHDDLDPELHRLDGVAFGAQLIQLADLADRLETERRRGLPPERYRQDFSFAIDGDPATPDARVSITPRARGSRLDRLVAEWMIYANTQWGRMLALTRAPGMFRAQFQGKTRMTTQPQAHQGLNVAQYLWASSPLRRYADLVNQRQLLAVAVGDKPPYGQGDADLFAAASDFDATYATYAEFQRQMEYFWCLRWLQQESISEITAFVLRENLVRFEHVPIVTRVADLAAAPGAHVRIAIGAIDLFELTLECRHAGAAADGVVADLEDLALDDETSQGERGLESQGQAG